MVFDGALRIDANTGWEPETAVALIPELDAMLDTGQPVPAVALVDGQPVQTAVALPRTFLRMRELVAALETRGVACWVVSASSEELVRLLVCDPARGLPIPPERVCGCNVLLEAPDRTVTWGAKARSAGSAPWRTDAWRDLRQTVHPVAPLTWYEGKVAAVRTWIEPVKRPLLAAGDSPSDIPMQLLVDTSRGGIRLAIRRADATPLEASEKRPGTDALDGWVMVSPAELAPE